MKKKLLISLLLGGGALSLQAQDAARLAAQAENNPLFKEYPCVNLLDSTAVRIQDSGSGSFHIRKIVRIQNEAGALQNRVIVYDYDPLTAEAHFEKVTVHRANGEVTAIDVKQTKDYTAPARAIYWGAKQIMIEVGALQPGDIVDYTIAKRGFTYALLASPADDESRFIPPMKGEFYDIIPFWSETPTLRKVYRIGIPKHRDMQYKVYQGNCATAVQYEGAEKIYTFSLNEMLPVKREPNMVDLFDCAPKIIASSTPNWEEKSKWFSRVNEEYGSFESIPEAEKLVKKLLKGKKTELEKIEVLAHWVADNIRYSGITMGEGEGFTLHNLKMNFTDRCGVCKDIASTLVSFLRIAGFKAYPAMTMAGSRIERAIPADHFNHCVAVVEREDGTLMPIDPTWIPFSRELWSSAEQQQNYLPGTPDGSDLCQTPVSAAENHYLRFLAKTKLQTNGTLTGRVTVSAEGYTDLGVRGIFTKGWKEQWYNHIEQQIKAVSPRAKLVRADWGKDPRDYMAAPFKLELAFEIPDYAVVGEEEMLVKPFVMNNFYARNRNLNRLTTSMEKRENGFTLPCSQLVEMNESMELPAGYTLLSEETSTQCSGAAASQSAIYSIQGKQLNFLQTISLNKRVYTADDWNEVRQAIMNYKQFENPVILKK